MMMVTRMAVCGVFVATILAIAPAHARDDGMAGVLVDGFYGGLIGALVGTAVMAMTDDPGDHLNYISTGAGIGVIGGTIYGLAGLTRYAAVTIEPDRVVWRLPTVETNLQTTPGDLPSMQVSATWLRVNFR